MVQLKQPRRAVVFGGSGNIGQAICEKLAAHGWSLLIQYHTQKNVARGLANHLSDTYPHQEFQILALDMMSSEANYQQVLTVAGDFQALVFAQGITDYQLFSATPLPVIKELFQLHLFGPMALIQLAESQLMQHDHGRIVFIGSIYGGFGSAMEVAYSSVKGAQSSFANAYAREVAGSGVTVNVVAPGAVNTQMNNEFSENDLTALKADIPLGRLAQPEEIAVWVNHLLAADADYLTGQTVYVNGGWLK